LGFAIWTALALISAIDGIVWRAYNDRPVDSFAILAFSLADWYTCGLFIPGLVAATKRWPIVRGRIARRVPLHLGLILVASVAKIALFQRVRPLLPGLDEFPLGSMLVSGTIDEMIAFGSVAGVLHAAEFYRRYQERETLAVKLEARLSDAQLRALRGQLDSHFLFNTLNAATALIHRDPDAADLMLTRLGELLRLTLRHDPAHESPLGQ
jgi:two-component system LytT family sensor kinase